MPAFADVPNVEIEFIETEDRHGTMGAKSIGEIGIHGVAPAVANAVYDAVGVRYKEMPLMPHTVLKGIHKSAGAKT